MPADRRSFHDTLEPVLYWDTSFAIPDLFEEEPNHIECRDFAARLHGEASLSLVSDFVLDELAFWAVKGELVEVARHTGQRWGEVKRDRPEVVRSAYSGIAAKRLTLESQTLKLNIPDAVTNRAFQLMHDFALLPTDAYHIATALESGVNAFVTLDQDFLDVEGIIVYTCLS